MCFSSKTIEADEVPKDNNEKCNLKFKDDKLVYETFSAVFNTKLDNKV